MIKIVRGNLLEAKENIIGHQVNCRGVMGSGVAQQVKRKFPVAFETYKQTVDDYIKNNIQKDLLGYTDFAGIDKDKYIANMFGQYNYGLDNVVYTNIEALYECFDTVRTVAEKNNFSVALPYMIGCYRGGADWKVVEDLLLTAFDGYEVTLYKLNRG